MEAAPRNHAARNPLQGSPLPMAMQRTALQPVALCQTPFLILPWPIRYGRKTVRGRRKEEDRRDVGKRKAGERNEGGTVREEKGGRQEVGRGGGRKPEDGGREGRRRRKGGRQREGRRRAEVRAGRSEGQRAEKETR